MKKENILIVIAVGGFLYLGGYTSLAKAVAGLAILATLITGIKKSIKSSGEQEKDKSSNTMDPIEIETTRKPDYQIPSDIIMTVSPDKSPSKPGYMKAVKGASEPVTKYIGKKLKD